MDDINGTVSLRPSLLDQDLDALHSIRKQAWEVAYKHIYSQNEIQAYFDGQSCERRTWSNIPCEHEETMICYLDSKEGGEEEDEEKKKKKERNDKGLELESPNEDGKKKQKHESNMVIIGYATWCYAKNGKGEVKSLYIHPNYWNRRCGSRLWDHIMNQCKKENVTSLDIWVLDQSRSKEFYVSKGCEAEGRCGDYFIGEHKEKAVCYHKYFHDETKVSEYKQETTKNGRYVIYVDVIVPVHNAQDTIEETIHSAMKQNMPLHLLQESVTNTVDDGAEHFKRYLDDYERLSLQNVHIDIALCCYDDGSTDESFEILKRLKDHYDGLKSVVKNDHTNEDERMTKNLFICHSSDGKSRGAGYARNRAASLRDKASDIPVNVDHKKANSFVCLLDSDDVMHEHRVAEQVSVMLKMPPKKRNATLIGCTFKRIPEDSTWHYTQWANNLSDDRLLLEKFREITILQPTWMVTRHRFDLLGGYIESLDGFNSHEVEHEEKHNRHEIKVYKLIHPVHDNAQTIRLAEDLRFFHAHLNYEEDKGHPGTLQLIRTHQPLLLYRHRLGQSQSSSTSRKLLLQLRTKAFVDTVIWNNPKWRYCNSSKKGGLVIWGAGRDGKEFFKSLPDEIKVNVRCFVDVDEKKIKSGYYVPPPSPNKRFDASMQPKKRRNKNTPNKIPIVHFSLAARDDDKREMLMNEWICPTASTLDAENNGRITKESPSNQKGLKRMKVNHSTESEELGISIPKRQLHGLSKKDKHNQKMLDELKDLPVVVCVAMYRSNGVLEKNVENIGRQEGFDLWHFS